jgi:two-component system CitB family sensor kinase
LKLQTKLILLIGSLLLLILAAFGLTIESMHTDTVKKQIGTRALDLAETVALLPEIRRAFQTDNPSATIQPLVESIRQVADAEFIVVGNREGVRYSHPQPEQIGKSMVGGDNEPVLEGASIISEAVGSLGPSLRGKAPIYDEDGRLIGIVSVGFLLRDVEHMTEPDRIMLLRLSLLSLLVGLAGALLIARSVKKAILGLEPQEIGRLYLEKQAVLESIREGILAANQHGIVTMVNQNAVKLLNLPEGPLVGSTLLDVHPTSRLMDVVRSGEAEYDRETIVGEDILLVNRVPVRNPRGQVIGAVATFRDKSELSKVTEELSQVKRYAESLRAQTHEYSNKLYTISGLIQLESYQEAIELITHESDIHQNLVHFLLEEVPDPMIGGLLIGKFNRANELKIELVINPDSTFADLPADLDRSQIVTILGNLIDNAMEAVLATDSDAKKVHVFLTDLGDDLILEVEDTGRGIAPMDVERIYEIGYSTKLDGEHRGFGLALVKKATQQLGGYITYTANEPSGSIFTVAIPKWK